LDLLRHHSRFTLKSNDEHDVLSHAQALRLQVGGIRGLERIIEVREEPVSYVDDIHDLLKRAVQLYDQLDQLPFNEIIQQVAAFKGRHGSRG
ncbi:MAG: hypothetical protein OQL28_13665, partial [Sedimenticola sp.]|nr:hypothetical protein [Sedimenticola sp.]